MSRARALQLALIATLIAVPLVFTTAMRSFAAAKIAVLELGVGTVLVLAAFVPDRVRVPARVVLAIAALVGLGVLARPDLEGLAAAGWLAALGGLAAMVAVLSPGWSTERLRTIVAVPLALGLALSLLQSVGIAVLDASTEAFGTTHGAVVGTVGNPVENTWFLLLGATLLHGLVPGRARWIAIVAVAWIIVVDRSRAAAGIGALALAWPWVRRAGVGPRVAAIAALAIATLVLVRWDGIVALRGRGFLLEVGGSMLADAWLVPQGAGAFARDFPAAQAAALVSTPEHAAFASTIDHAHCDVLELGYELGLPGLAALAWLGWALARALQRDPSPRRRTAVATLAIGAALGLVGYPLFSPACACMLALAMGLALAPVDGERGLGLARSLPSLVLGAGLIVLGTRQAAAELAITRALAAHAANDDATGLVHARRAVALFPGADAWFFLGNLELAQGDRARAAVAYQRSLALRPRATTAANLAACLAPPIADAWLDASSIDGELPMEVFDAAFRARVGRPPEPRGRGFVLDDSYKDPQIVEDLLRAYHERYPEITALVEIGRTHQDRPIWALKISDSAAVAEDEPAMLLDGAHHSSELLAVEYVLDVVDRILTGYGEDPRAMAWVDGLEIWCVPVVNPDGLHRFMHETRFGGRKNARDNDEDGVVDPFDGVDINRNYPFGWGEPGSSGNPIDDRYRGPAPASEPETQAMMRLAEREHFAAVLSFHVWGTDLYSAYLVDTRRDLEPDVAKAIGIEIAAAAPLQPSGKWYDVRNAPRRVAGCAHDWHMHEYGALAYVVEGSHHNPNADIRTSSIERTRPLWGAMLDRVLDGPWIGGHVRDSAGNPLVAEVMLAEIHTFEGESWKTRARDGRFDRAVATPGSYTLVVRVDGKDRIERRVEIAAHRVDVDIVIP